jgi:hypothetical protein
MSRSLSRTGLDRVHGKEKRPAPSGRLLRFFDSPEAIANHMRFAGACLFMVFLRATCQLALAPRRWRIGSDHASSAERLTAFLRYRSVQKARQLWEERR